MHAVVSQDAEVLQLLFPSLCNNAKFDRLEAPNTSIVHFSCGNPTLDNHGKNRGANKMAHATALLHYIGDYNYWNNPFAHHFHARWHQLSHRVLAITNDETVELKLDTQKFHPRRTVQKRQRVQQGGADRQFDRLEATVAKQIGVRLTKKQGRSTVPSAEISWSVADEDSDLWPRIPHDERREQEYPRRYRMIQGIEWGKGKFPPPRFSPVVRSPPPTNPKNKHHANSNIHAFLAKTHTLVAPPGEIKTYWLELAILIASELDSTIQEVCDAHGDKIAKSYGAPEGGLLLPNQRAFEYMRGFHTRPAQSDLVRQFVDGNGKPTRGVTVQTLLMGQGKNERGVAVGHAVKVTLHPEHTVWRYRGTTAHAC